MKVTIAPETNQTCNGEPFAPQPHLLAEPALIKKKELAKRLSVSTRTIDEWVRLRKIPYIQIGPRFYLYDFDAVLAALKKHYGVEPRTR
jgi:excisionase family DNA binding protein